MLIYQYMKRSISNLKAFTIVELLVVIVVIGILAAITIVSYSGVANKAITASIKNDLDNNLKMLKMYHIDHGYYPSSLDSNYCPNAPDIDNKYCLKAMTGATLSYSGGNQTFTLIDTHTQTTISYQITESGESGLYVPSYVMAWGGKTGDDRAAAITASTDGGYVIAGYAQSFSGAFIAKYTSSGVLSWNRIWGSTGGSIKSIATSSDGCYIVTGVTNNFGAGNIDAFIVKFDSTGSLLWSKTWGGTGDDGANAVIVVKDGGYVISGETRSFGSGSRDIFYAKFTVDGELSWSKTWGGSSHEYVGSLASTDDGGFVVAGKTSSYQDTISGDAFLAKFTSDGTLSWNKTWGGYSADSANRVIITADGGYVIAGQTYSFGAGGYDAFLAKFTSDGTLLWNKTWGGSSFDVVNGITAATDGGYVIVGWTTLGAGVYDAFLVKFSSDGNLSWNKTFGGSSSDYGNDIITLPDGGYIVAGETANYGAGNYDALIAKYKSDGDIKNCTTPMCQSPTVAVSSPVATVTSPTAGVTSFSATITTPSVTITIPPAISTPIVSAL